MLRHEPGLGQGLGFRVRHLLCRETALLIDPASASIQDYRYVSNVIAHEMTHQVGPSWLTRRLNLQGLHQSCSTDGQAAQCLVFWCSCMQSWQGQSLARDACQNIVLSLMPLKKPTSQTP